MWVTNTNIILKWIEVTIIYEAILIFYNYIFKHFLILFIFFYNTNEYMLWELFLTVKHYLLLNYGYECLSVCTYVHCICPWSFQSPEKCVKFLQTGVADCCETSCGYWLGSEHMSSTRETIDSKHWTVSTGSLFFHWN